MSTPSTIPFPTQSTGGVSTQQVRAPYIKYALAVNYSWDGGVLQLPVAYVQNQAGVQNPTQVPYQQRQPCVLIQVAAPMGRKVVIFEIARLGAPCVAPDPTPSNSNETLLSAVATPAAPVLDANGGASLYRMSGQYIYALSRPLFTNDALSSGSTPADNSTTSGNAIGPSNFSQGIV